VARSLEDDGGTESAVDDDMGHQEEGRLIVTVKATDVAHGRSLIVEWS
jgi:hypothetical protein